MIEARQRPRAPHLFVSNVRKAAGRPGLASLCLVFALLTLCVAPRAAFSANQQIDAGAAELRAGRYQSAIQQLTEALGDENLTSREAATVLYYRGMANRKLGRHAQAIADLGNGIFLGLASTDRVTAQVERGFAFRDLGLAEESKRELAYAQKAAPNQASRLIEQGGGNIGEIATSTQQVAVGGFWDRLSPFGGGSAPAPAPAQTPTTTAGPGATEGWSTSVATGDQTVPASPPTPAPTPTATASPTPEAAQAPSPAPEPQSSGNRLTRWFGSWGNSYAEPPSQTASTSGGGGYRLQLAASRSEAEARQLWQKVSAANPSLSGKTPEIEKADIGDLGTFYRLQIGPFSDKAQSEKLCNDLKRSGVECFLVVSR